MLYRATQTMGKILNASSSGFSHINGEHFSGISGRQTCYKWSSLGGRIGQPKQHDLGLIQIWGLGLGRLKLAFEIVVGNPGIVDHALDHPFGGYYRNILTLGVQLLADSFGCVAVCNNHVRLPQLV